MPTLLITSDRPGVGKTALAGALALELGTAGKKVAYLKPFTPLPVDDPDVKYFEKVLPPSERSEGLPVLLTEGEDLVDGSSLLDDHGQTIRTVVEGLASKSDVVLVEGPSFTTPVGATSTVSAELAQILDARVLLVQGYFHGLRVQEIGPRVSAFDQRLIGTLINLLPQYRRHQLEGELELGGFSDSIGLLGMLPSDRTMFSATVGQIADGVNARWIAGQEGADRLVEHLLIGGNLMDHGDTYFGRHENKAVIVRADRPDLQLACLNTSVACLLLTEGHTPNQYVRQEAENLEVPLLLVDTNTVETTRALESVFRASPVHHPAKFQHFRELLTNNVDRELLVGRIQGIAKRG